MLSTNLYTQHANWFSVSVERKAETWQCFHANQCINTFSVKNIQCLPRLRNSWDSVTKVTKNYVKPMFLTHWSKRGLYPTSPLPSKRQGLHSLRLIRAALQSLWQLPTGQGHSDNMLVQHSDTEWLAGAVAFAVFQVMVQQSLSTIASFSFLLSTSAGYLVACR